VSTLCSKETATVGLPYSIPDVVKLTRLRAIRERKALSQRELAAKAGVSPVTVARIETGQDEPYPSTVRKLAAALGVEPAELMDPLERQS
jgi:transcriptional regulator with XRE-family HTH domain